jgi:hypothetical protein
MRNKEKFMERASRNSEKRKHYKVVENIHGKLLSANAFGFYEVEYKKDKWVTAKRGACQHGYGLFVFANKERALKYSRRQEVWECQVRGKHKYLPYFIGMHPNYKAFRKFAYCIDDFDNPFSTSKWPRGTVMVKAVKLTKKIKGGEY